MARPKGEIAPARDGMTAPADRQRVQPDSHLAWVDGRPAASEMEARLARGDEAEDARVPRSGARPDLRPIEGRGAEARKPEPNRTAPASKTARDAPAGRTAKAAPRNRRGLWLALIVMLAAGAGWYWYHGGQERVAGLLGRQGALNGQAAGPARQPDNRVPVQAVSVRQMDVPIYFEGLGTVQAFNTVLIRSRVDGELMEVAFREGQMVRKGNLLARIDPRPYQAALDQAVAKKAQDEATLSSSRLDLGRTQKLAGQSFATGQQLDQQTATVGAQTALLASDQAQIDNAGTQLSYATIRSPLDGRTGIRLVDQGNIVRSSDQAGIVEITQIQPISVLFTAPESQLPAIGTAKAESDVTVIALSSDGKTQIATGVLSLINNTVDAASGTVRLKATFPNEDGKLWPGLSINTRLLARTLKNVATVPESAVMRGTSELFVFRIGEGDKVEKRVVKVGDFAGGIAVIEDGLKPGDRVVTAGQSRLSPGTAVKVEPAPGEKPGSQPADDKPQATGSAPGQAK